MTREDWVILAGTALIAVFVIAMLILGHI